MGTITQSVDAQSAQAKPGSSLLSIREVSKSFGKNLVLRRISLEVAEGEFLTILGESGSGKTTLLRIIAGFENADLWIAPSVDTESINSNNFLSCDTFKASRPSP